MAVEVFNRIGEAEMHESSSNFYKRQREDNDDFEPVHKIESSSKPISNAKKEFLKHLEDDSLTIDTCEKMNHDWKKK
jgi:hypothetical protein